MWYFASFVSYSIDVDLEYHVFIFVAMLSFECAVWCWFSCLLLGMCLRSVVCGLFIGGCLCGDDGVVCSIWMGACCWCGDWVDIVFGDMRRLISVDGVLVIDVCALSVCVVGVW